jgi:hypothetical protein
MLEGVRSKVKTGLAHWSFLLAQSGGIMASVSMVGGWLTSLAAIGPWWLKPALFAVTLTICIGDWAEGDATPNRRAIYTAMMWPSFLVASLTGDAGAKLFGAIGAISKETAADWKSGVKNWTDLPGDLESAFTVFSLIVIVMAATFAQQYAKKSKAATATAVTGAPVATRRR